MDNTIKKLREKLNRIYDIEKSIELKKHIINWTKTRSDKTTIVVYASGPIDKDTFYVDGNLLIPILELEVMSLEKELEQLGRIINL
ncbi:hypothetical protein EFM07_11215 [Lactococcus lactis]|uniref:hypothetical protein n=1 Tax=Lactococcus lactis TaxID=1358 RepID=UPI00223B420C|nr:hypothetical protein [Lactococcus lactis]MCT1227941.1 hypothetical protein [Lactococcus lactis]